MATINDLPIEVQNELYAKRAELSKKWHVIRRMKFALQMQREHAIFTPVGYAFRGMITKGII